MRSISVLVGLSALGHVAAQPSKHRGHAHLHLAVDKRDEGPVVVTKYEYVIEKVPSVTVYVDDNGSILYSNVRPTVPATSSVAPSSSKASSKEPSKPAPSTTLVTSTSAAAPPPSSSAPPSSSSSEAPPPPPSSSAAPAPAPPAYTTPAPAPAPAPAPSSPPANNNDPTNFRGVAYSPYKGTYGQNVNCKSADDIKNDFNMIDASKWDVVRIYGTDCNQVANVVAAAQPKGIRVYAGVYDVNNWKAEIDVMATTLKGNWGAVHTISIGNESVHKGLSMDAVLDALRQAREYLRTLGYNGWVVAVDTFMVAKADPRLCKESDYAAVNMHPYWDYNTASGDAGTFMQDQIKILKGGDLCGDRPLVISETGWPSSGATKGKAVCSPEDQSKAISSITGALGQGYVLLAAFDDWWKNPGPDGVEQMFGLMGTAPSG
ncbi:hypothetical protein KVT40_001673 [Elsinoe batatas]|uniref:Uncharacterized protein n=1 Tax=Elsinoe batatas TaxID=2601811 RepID=A0A8K0L7S3_9PEZI|nr:hypothetical protein KVT40_001673 [Elsinoe batatas]